MRWPNDNPWWIPPFLGGVPDVEPRLVSTPRPRGARPLLRVVRHLDAHLGAQVHRRRPRHARGLARRLPRRHPAGRPAGDPPRAASPIASVGAASSSPPSSGPASARSRPRSCARRTQFVVLQMVSRVFMVAGVAAALVIVTEEFPAEHRGWAIGMLGALAACGHGLGAILFAAIDAPPRTAGASSTPSASCRSSSCRASAPRCPRRHASPHTPRSGSRTARPTGSRRS